MSRDLPKPFTVVLKDNITVATLIPINQAVSQVPIGLQNFLRDEFNNEITKPQSPAFAFINPMSLETFCSYWFASFTAMMLIGDHTQSEDALMVLEQQNQHFPWESVCLGSFTIRPQFAGHSAHICSGSFLVNQGVRNTGVGKVLVNTFQFWAWQLGFTKVYFDSVYSTNKTTISLLQKSGFHEVGVIKNAAVSYSNPRESIDIILFDKEIIDSSGKPVEIPGLITNSDPGNVNEQITNVQPNSVTVTLVQPEGPPISIVIGTVDVERWGQIKNYLIHRTYPEGFSKKEKNKIRNNSHIYKISEDGKLMTRGKEVVMEPQRQARIIQKAHIGTNHAGINRTVSAITEMYHWNRIKELAVQYIGKCEYCQNKDGGSRSSGKQSSMNTPAQKGKHGGNIDVNNTDFHTRNQLEKEAAFINNYYRNMIIDQMAVQNKNDNTNYESEPEDGEEELQEGEGGYDEQVEQYDDEDDNEEYDETGYDETGYDEAEEAEEEEEEGEDREEGFVDYENIENGDRISYHDEISEHARKRQRTDDDYTPRDIYSEQASQHGGEVAFEDESHTYSQGFSEMHGDDSSEESDDEQDDGEDNEEGREYEEREQQQEYYGKGNEGHNQEQYDNGEGYDDDDDDDEEEEEYEEEDDEEEDEIATMLLQKANRLGR
ncbi:Spt10 protein [Saccharomycopsis crataegensis]|uniref:Spt10 protein n=1 Tax=Saccharomycopsis crataegensis TaxID=43959 RepID=A0AAV5QMD3_9ASCO|nr:Spt10 protein [Saccharomycopsis crataegensis]